jgi:hypothetical protein
MSYMNQPGRGEQAKTHPTSLKPTNNRTFWHKSMHEDSLYGTPQTFSFTDVHATAIMPFVMPGATEPPTVMLPGLTLISISEHRDVYPVVSLGRRGINGFTTGHKTTAGTLAFVDFGESPWAGVIRKYAAWRGTPEDTIMISPDQLPPIDISIILHNDKGDAATILIRSMKILDSSRNISVRDIQLSEVFSFMAANVTHIINAQRQFNYVPFETPKGYTSKSNPYLDRLSATLATTTETVTVTSDTPPPTTETTTTVSSTVSTTTTTTTATPPTASTDTAEPTTISETTAPTITAAPTVPSESTTDTEETLPGGD